MRRAGRGRPDGSRKVDHAVRVRRQQLACAHVDRAAVHADDEWIHVPRAVVDGEAAIVARSALDGTPASLPS
jgi:hypothetical protein